MIKEFLLPELKRQRKLCSMSFQQDVATCHTSKITTGILLGVFGSRLISRFASLGWPPHSPDLSTCDFFLWDIYSQGYMYRSRVHCRHWKRIVGAKSTRYRRECCIMCMRIWNKDLADVLKTRVVIYVVLFYAHDLYTSHNKCSSFYILFVWFFHSFLFLLAHREAWSGQNVSGFSQGV